MNAMQRISKPKLRGQRTKDQYVIIEKRRAWWHYFLDCGQRLIAVMEEQDYWLIHDLFPTARLGLDNGYVAFFTRTPKGVRTRIIFARLIEFFRQVDELGWGEAATKGLIVHILDGNHNNLCRSNLKPEPAAKNGRPARNSYHVEWIARARRKLIAAGVDPDVVFLERYRAALARKRKGNA